VQDQQVLVHSWPPIALRTTSFSLWSCCARSLIKAQHQALCGLTTQSADEIERGDCRTGSSIASRRRNISKLLADALGIAIENVHLNACIGTRSCSPRPRKQLQIANGADHSSSTVTKAPLVAIIVPAAEHSQFVVSPATERFISPVDTALKSQRGP
jgi:hypothetical protein